MKLRRTPRTGRWARAVALVALLSTMLIAGGRDALAQDGGGGVIRLVNRDREFVERRKDGAFVARPVFDRRLTVLAYGVRHPDDGEWLAHVTQVHGGERRLPDGNWEYTFDYPGLDGQPDLDPERVYVLFLLAEWSPGELRIFHTVIPVYQPTGLWDRVIAAFDPSRWARAFARWIVEGVHGTLCGIVERATGADADDCEATP